MPNSKAYPGLERVPGKQNWVDKAGGLPSYIERIAKHLHYEKGMDIGHSIAIAVNTVKRWATAGTVTKKGGKGVTPATRAKAAKAVAEWEAKKARSRAKSATNMSTGELNEPWSDDYAISLLLSAGDFVLDKDSKDGYNTDMDNFDKGKYELALALKRRSQKAADRGNSGLSLSRVILFDPKKHPRDYLGKFRDLLDGMKVGDTATVKPSSGGGQEVDVKKTSNGFKVNSSDGSHSMPSTSDAASRAALEDAGTPKAKSGTMKDVSGNATMGWDDAWSAWSEPYNHPSMGHKASQDDAALSLLKSLMPEQYPADADISSVRTDNMSAALDKIYKLDPDAGVTRDNIGSVIEILNKAAAADKKVELPPRHPSQDINVGDIIELDKEHGQAVMVIGWDDQGRAVYEDQYGKVASLDRNRKVGFVIPPNSGKIYDDHRLNRLKNAVTEFPVGTPVTATINREEIAGKVVSHGDGLRGNLNIKTPDGRYYMVNVNDIKPLSDGPGSSDNLKKTEAAVASAQSQLDLIRRAHKGNVISDDELAKAEADFANMKDLVTLQNEVENKTPFGQAVMDKSFEETYKPDSSVAPTAGSTPMALTPAQDIVNVIDATFVGEKIGVDPNSYFPIDAGHVDEEGMKTGGGVSFRLEPSTSPNDPVDRFAVLLNENTGNYSVTQFAPDGTPLVRYDNVGVDQIPETLQQSVQRAMMERGMK